MEEEKKLSGSYFGYNSIVTNGNTIITLKGDMVPELDIDMKVVLLGDSRGYIPSNFQPGEEVTIIEFAEPFTDSHTDHIIRVSNGEWDGWIKPSNIQKTAYQSNLRVKADANHRRNKKWLGVTFAEFMDIVYKSMTDTDRERLPATKMEYINAIVSFALNHLQDFADKLSYTIAKVYSESTDVRFIQDPINSSNTTQAVLYLDKEGYIISIINPAIVLSATTPSYKFIKDYDSYIVLNGPLQGKKFYAHDRPPGEPIYQPVLPADTTKASDLTRSNSTAQKPPIRVFISYAHKDEKLKNELVEHLSGLKQNNIISDWTDRKILGGELWDERIKQNLEDSKIILFLVSASFMHSGYINEVEIKHSIEKHAKGDAIVVPIIIRFCDFKSLPLHAFQALPKNAKPIEDWKPRNKGWLDVVEQLKKIIASVK